jgi:ADP-heptose:LPS heptosyltransferase
MKTFPQTNTVVMIASGGVGEFLFQLDLAKRLEKEGVRTVFFIKKKFHMFAQMVQASNCTQVTCVSVETFFVRGMLQFFATCISTRVTLVNSFNSLGFSAITKALYFVVQVTRGRVVVCKKDKHQKTPYETLYYKEGEVIWERNNRIVEYITHKESNLSFPVLFPSYTQRAVSVPYIYIHPVGSSYKKSYPITKLMKLLSLRKDINWVCTVTPSEEKWYVTEEFKVFLQNNPHVTFQSKYFSLSEVLSFMTASKAFITVNTGLLWLASMLTVPTIVIDTFTDFEWNPSFAHNVTRLAHDYDAQGNSLHLKEVKHEDGTFFESMYLVTPEEVNKALKTHLAI